MRRKLTIALLGALAVWAMVAPQASAAKRAPATLVSDKAKTAPVTSPVGQLAQYDGPFKRRFRPRPRRWGGGYTRRTYGGARYITMREAVAIVRSRYPGRILHAGLRGGNWWFRIIHRGRVRDVYIPRLRAGPR